MQFSNQFIGIFCYLLSFELSSSLRVSSKLDFEESKVIQTKPSTLNPLQYKTVKRADSISIKDDTVSLLCGTNGCNKIGLNNESKDSIQTDVVVHVQTNVDLVKKNESKFIDDTPDVPVIIGYGGSYSDNSKHEPNIDPPSFRKQYSSIPHNPNVANGYSPSVQFDAMGYKNIQSNSPSDSPKNDYGHDFQNDGIYSLVQQPYIKIQTLPALSFTMTNEGRVKDIRYNRNGLELHVPYFEPSYNNHYFGESSPPQSLWYPKQSTSSNPVAFRNTHKATWNPSLWANRIPTMNVYHNLQSNTRNLERNQCNCKNHPDSDFTHFIPRVNGQDPGAHIDDKLGPLD